MARKKIPDEPIKTNFFEKLGSKAGIFISIGSAIVMCSAAGSYLTSIVKEQEILKILTANSKEVSRYENEISDLKSNVRDLKFRIKNDSIINSKNGKSNK